MTLGNMRANGVRTLAVWCEGRGEISHYLRTLAALSNLSSFSDQKLVAAHHILRRVFANFPKARAKIPYRLLSLRLRHVAGIALLASDTRRQLLPFAVPLPHDELHSEFGG
jgi:hypothetical protein